MPVLFSAITNQRYVSEKESDIGSDIITISTFRQIGHELPDSPAGTGIEYREEEPHSGHWGGQS